MNNSEQKMNGIMNKRDLIIPLPPTIISAADNTFIMSNSQAMVN